MNIIKVGYNPLISEDISIRHDKLRLRFGQFVFNALFEMVAAYRQLPQGLHNIVTHCLYVCIALYFTLHDTSDSLRVCTRRRRCDVRTDLQVLTQSELRQPPPHAGIHNSVSRYPVSSVYISSILSTIRYTMRPFSPVLTLLTICGCVSGEPCMRACHHSAACSMQHCSQLL